ncbi:RCC1-like G exchanging factor-like protein [Bombus flavifrons]|uniref:RCC1-like G exchanging factor-like protein n=1 Tax=Bombus flavifrons TaxID=103934 RepID=UPI003703D259
MLNIIKTSLKKNVQQPSRIIEFSEIKNKIPLSKPLPVFQYPISNEREHRIYVWGLAEHGALGTLKTTIFKNGISYIPRPKRLVFGERHDVTDITCGYGFTAFAVKSKDKNILYGSGINTDSQLGFNEKDKKFPNGLITEPRPINLPIKDSSTKVLDMSAGRAHLLVLTNEGVFTLGNNAYGQCGRPIISNENYENSRVVHHIPNIKEKKIKAVTAGQDHSILLTESGEVYTFGWGADGQTGLAHYRNEHRPSLVKGDLAGQHIIKVACVADCVLALSDKGNVFGWGNSEYAQLLMEGENQQINIATELSALKKLGHIVDIACGGCFCMILNNTGEVYVWGYGILGFGPEVKKSQQPIKIPSVLFGNNVYQKNTKVVKIFCGMSHLAALTNTGDLYMWGCNKFGSLGLGDLKDQYFPLKVTVGAQVKKVACGIDHTVTLCKPFI